jgi:hypothetical protein
MRAKQVEFDSDGDLAFQNSAGQSAVLPIGADGQILTTLDASGGVIGWAPPAASTSGAVFSCPATVAVGDVVYISGSGTVDVASTEAGAGQTADAIGVVSSKPTSVTAVVNFSGIVAGFSGLTPGSIYYQAPGTPGGITTTAPSGSGEKAHRIGVATSTVELLVSLNTATAIK